MVSKYTYCPIPKHHRWLTQVRRTLLLAVLIISVSLAIGIAGYHYFGHLSWINSLLEAAMILGGEGPIAPMDNDAVKLFASIYALYSGLVLLTTTGLLLSPWVHTMMYHTHRQAAHDAIHADDEQEDKMSNSKAKNGVSLCELTPEQHRVLREEGTEHAFTSPLLHIRAEGEYLCAGCGARLFPSNVKFDSGTGWPSFYDAYPGALETKTDYHIGVARTEYHCARCGGHQGHVFPDGPRPTGLRYCNNGLALTFKPKA